LAEPGDLHRCAFLFPLSLPSLFGYHAGPLYTVAIFFLVMERQPQLSLFKPPNPSGSPSFPSLEHLGYKSNVLHSFALS
jgi:hypothetical protein